MEAVVEEMHSHYVKPEPPSTLEELNKLFLRTREVARENAFYFWHYTQLAQTSEKIKNIQSKVIKNNYVLFSEAFNILPSHIGLKKYVLYYNILFPEGDTFATEYTLMPNACGTLSLAFDGVSVNAELWGATTLPIPLGAEPNRYRILLLIQLSPYGLYQITRQSQLEFADPAPSA